MRNPTLKQTRARAIERERARERARGGRERGRGTQGGREGGREGVGRHQPIVFLVHLIYTERADGLKCKPGDPPA